MYSIGQYINHHQTAALVVSLVCLKNGIKSVPPVPTSVILLFSFSADCCSIFTPFDAAVAIFILPTFCCGSVSGSLIELRVAVVVVVLFDAMMI